MTNRTANKTGRQIIRDQILGEEVQYLVGISGHMIVTMLDASRTIQNQIKILQVRHEQSAVHLTDGCYRVTGKPLAVFTSIGPGALNTAIRLGASYIDSTAALARVRRQSTRQKSQVRCPNICHHINNRINHNHGQANQPSYRTT